MRITRENIRAKIGLHDVSTGALLGEVETNREIEHRNYSIKRLNMKIWQEGLDRVIENTCNSKKQIQMFNYVKNSVDKNGRILLNQTQMSKDMSTVRSATSKFVSSLQKEGFIEKESNGIYIMNPFIIKPKGMTNADCEMAQESWAMTHGVPDRI